MVYNAVVLYGALLNTRGLEVKKIETTESLRNLGFTILLSYIYRISPCLSKPKSRNLSHLTHLVHVTTPRVEPINNPFTLLQLTCVVI